MKMRLTQKSFKSTWGREPWAFGDPHCACLCPFHTPHFIHILELLGLKNSWWRSWLISIQFFKWLEQFIIPAFPLAWDEAPPGTWGPVLLQMLMYFSLQCGFLQASNSQLAYSGVGLAVNTTSHSFNRGLLLVRERRVGEFPLLVAFNSCFRQAVCYGAALWMLITGKPP